MKRHALALGLGATLALGGCYNVTYIAKSRTPAPTKVEHGMTFWFWGLAGTGEVRTDQLCPQTGAARINTQQTFVDVLLNVITLGIYAPRHAMVTCAQ